MKVNVEVQMKAEYIFDLLLFHTYSKFSGFLVNMLGLAVMIAGGFLLGAGKIEVYQSLFYILAGIAFIGYTPLTLKKRAKKLMEQEKYQSVISYAFDENGIEENISDTVNHYGWDQVQKAIATPKDIAFYVQEQEALVVPKESFGQNFMPVMKLIAEQVTRDRIYIR